MKKYGVFLLLVLVSCDTFARQSKIGILVFEGFLTSDVAAPVEVFGAASKQAWFSNYEVVLISTTKDLQVKSEEGLKVLADLTIYDEVKLDVLIVPSAYSMEPHIKNTHLVSYIRDAHKKDAWIASNCSGATLLGEAGVLDGKHATTWVGGEKGLQRKYPKAKVIENTNVVVDGKVVTSNGGPVSYQGAFELLALLSSKKYAREIASAIQFDRIGVPLQL